MSTAAPSSHSDPEHAGEHADQGADPSDSRSRRARRREAEAAPWRGPVRRYDILKEGTIALVVVVLLVTVLAVLFSSPDVPPVTLQAWSSAQPIGFTQIALSELEGTSTSATYGPPYNHGSGSVQSLFGLSIQRAVGVTDPIHPATAFVIDPLSTIAGRPALKAALASYVGADQATRHAWDQAYGTALAKATMAGGHLVVPPASDGPVATMMSDFLSMARSGGLDSELVAHSSFYTTNYTNPILFLGDSATAQQSSYWNKIVTAQNLQGHQWGMMNETGSWPGQPWLWLYVMWYQIPPMSQSSNGDLEVVAIMTVLSIGLLLIPFIPGVRDLPRWIPIHRLVWKDYYRTYGSSATGTTAGGAGGSGTTAGGATAGGATGSGTTAGGAGGP